MSRVRSNIRGRRQSLVNKRSETTTAKDQRLQSKLSLKMVKTPLRGTPGNKLEKARQKICILIFAEQKDSDQVCL